MRRYTVVEAPRTVLLDDLTEHIVLATHLHPEQPERAEAYRQARIEVEAGAVEVWARKRLFRVSNFSAVTYGVTEGTRAELAAILDDYGASRALAGNETKAREIAEALIDLTERGLDVVRYNGIRYRVVED
jgi:aspartate aminotransferase-like enzyme